MTVKVLNKKRCLRKREVGHIPGIVFTYDAACRDYDWLLVYDEMADAERLACPWQHTILATQEPVSVKSYSKAYVRQFAHYLTNRPFEAERHPGWYFGRGYYTWYNGHTREELQHLDFLKKDRLISAVCSSKQMRHTQHHVRYELIRHLAGHVNGFDWFGRGVRPLEGGKKYAALDGYRYHVAVENHIAPGHWSEKIADSILSECLTFYAGDPDLGQVLPPDSFIPIPIDDPVAAEAIIRKAIADDEWTKRLPAIREAKRLLLEKYNLWAQVAALIENVPAVDRPGAAPRTIYPRKTLRLRNPLVALSDGIGHLRQFVKMLT